MIKRNAYIIICLCLLGRLPAFAQPLPGDEKELAKKYPFVSTVFNRVFNSTALNSFYEKLFHLKKDSAGTVSIVHIGDSHIQPDFLSGVVRSELQQYFGNAGRGLVFPYRLALSNAPDDIVSSSETRWEYNRVAHPEIPVAPGISGFVIRSSLPSPQLKISLRQNFRAGYQDFNRLRIFTDNDTAHYWSVQADNDTSSMVLHSQQDSAGSIISLPASATAFTLQASASGATKSFYGASLENSQPGVLYHTIGVNGARYDQYNTAELFWKQLPALKADLYIVSLGTNEAQRAAFNQTAFFKELDIFIGRLQQSSPGAAILITTAPDSYRARRYFNKVLQQLNKALADYCNKNYIPLWDLYRITNGYGSAYTWARRGLMSKDKVHFTADGYRLQGELLYHALAKGYNSYLQILNTPSAGN